MSALAPLGWLGLSVLAAGLAAIALHDALTGRRWLPDFADYLRLSARSLPAWDATCAANPNRSAIVICLTSTPTRLPRLAPTLKSLLYQTRAPACIRLHLPAYSQREERAYAIPEWLARLRSVDIVRCADLGPATKLLPALGQSPAAQPLLVVDDDRLYPSTLVADFERWSAAYPDCAVGASGWLAPADLTEKPPGRLWQSLRLPPPTVKCTAVRAPVQVDVLEGFAGYLVRPAFFDLASVQDYAGAPPAAFFVDDVWISAQCRAPKIVPPGSRFSFFSWADWPFFDRSALYRLNASGAPPLRNNSVMLRHFSRRWLKPR